VSHIAHESAYVDEDAEIGAGTRIWHFSHVMSGAKIGKHCVLGQNVYVASGAVIGQNVKVQNNVSIYSGVIIEDDVFLGPSCVLTNVSNPRSQIDRRALYERTIIRRGATIGANATIVCGVSIGRYAFVGAGAVVTRDVADYALVVGTPARWKGWMSRHGHPLAQGSDGLFRCRESGFRYQLVGTGELRCLDIAEDQSLAPSATTGSKSYREFEEPH
jgi:UDP-2-acetamido-3-amino-2,3-dideoxy-glucuronate N-acetyltransferase